MFPLAQTGELGETEALHLTSIQQGDIMYAMKITCAWCKKEVEYPDGKYVVQRSWQKYCSNNCRNSASAKRCYLPSPNAHLASGPVGAANELRVCADLLLKGYEVFRSVSHTCSCDLIVLKDGRTQRVEVKTGRRQGKKFTYFKQRPIKADVLVVVLPDELIYTPPLT